MGIYSIYKSLSVPRKCVAIAAAVFLLYTILGFFIAPTIVRSNLVSILTETFGRQVVVEQVRINPFALSLTVGDLEMSEPNGERFFHFDELYVNFQVSSLFHGAFTFAQIRMVAPDGKVQVLPNGQFNFSDIIATLGTSVSSTEQSGVLPPVLISQLHVERGRLAFSDLSHQTPFEVVVSPIQLSVESFSTKEESVGYYRLSAQTNQGEGVMCTGDVSVNPLSTQGTFNLSELKTTTAWKYIQDQVGFVMSDGLVDMDGGYRMGLSGDTLEVKLIEGTMQLGGMVLVEKGNGDELLSLSSLSVKGIDIELAKMEAEVDEVHVKGLRVRDRLEKDGMHSQKLFIPDSGSDGGAGFFTSSNSDAEKGPGWHFAVHEVNVEASRIFMENHTLPEIQEVNLDPVTVNLKNLSNEKGSKMKLSLELGLNKTGALHLTGEAGIDPVFAVIHATATKVPLISFQPTLNAFTKVNIVSGTADLDGTVNYMSLGNEGPVVRYEGRAKIEDLSISDQTFSEDLVKWESLSLNGMVCNLMPYGLKISDVVASKPYAKVIIGQDGTINLSTVLAMSEGKGGEEKLFLSKVLPAEVDQKRDGDLIVAEETSTFDLTSFPIKVDEVRFEDGSADFADFSLKPNFATYIHGLNGTVKGVTSEPGTKADVILTGEVDEHAPVNIAGKINLLSAKKYTDLSVDFKNMELTTVTPYSTKFAGYPIEKGKISLDLHYKLTKNVLVGENVILVDQLTLGDRIESEDAIKLPIKLAIALLKDRHGRIDIDMPVRGDLNDPKFNYGRVVVKAFVNLVTKIVTSPFSFLARQAGGGDEDLGSVEFEYGRSALSDGELGKLGKLAKAVYERPLLMLEIKASADTLNDRKALAERELHKRMFPEGGKNVLIGQDNSHTQELSISDEEYGRLIIEMYKSNFGHHPEKLFGSDGVEIMKNESGDQNAQPGIVDKVELPNDKAKMVEFGVIIAVAKRHLINKILIDDATLRTLAQERAKQIKNHLIEKGVPDEQIFILDVEINESKNDESIHTALSLSAR
ncbi:MAG: DUF748 domain-containing protein [Candidatus Scalindua sp. AMX11]|nr:MAG: DUF748 domain-containing protein [Candidatus Scalindua sp.]NOG83424.1 DUF748 domain-containing protein [Planctomycetota bacterium]RZV75063.1 MAG: DUF748 domain-containing protein [Candidatus Scalindua sp. SCAELEC01]TDE64324.1 MAG: DUF748 domain-containing protein [Candidatus Scalindua sp. AMX11]GJQ60616.1 MAG: hypothetical protein SCALA701_34170 [Candidatus Scalindua sp.]